MNAVEYEVIEGMSLVLQYKVQGYPYPRVTLRHNEENVLNETKVDVIYIIHNVSNLHNGDYTLTAENSLGKVSSTIKVKVIGEYCTLIDRSIAR